ncbi:hypothetical protein O0L34_g9767 [Tuta absoluta]|nr:hypothetical protein O0L34_g9767 [Tuta absoluta]
MCEANEKLKNTFTCYSTSLPHSTKTPFDNTCKSDINIYSEQNHLTGQSGSFNDLSIGYACKEYYKKYKHDEIPVKDFVISNQLIGDSDKIATLTNSPLDHLELRGTLKRYESQELQTDGSSVEGLDSHIKFFRTTVQKIFDTFYTNMRDYEGYKKRYNDILEKSKADTLNEMEDFIKDMIQHIVSAEPSNTSITTNLTYDIKAADVKTNDISNKFSKIESLDSLFEYRNKKYLCNQSMTTGESSSKKPSLQSGEIFNIYLVSSPPVEIKFNDRNLFSETNVKGRKPTIDSKIASADNLRREVLKKQEEVQDTEDNDREIPIKSSQPKKNIHLNEDFHNEHEKNERSMLYRFCSYFCKKFHKNS